jgi:hypothetical protein
LRWSQFISDTDQLVFHEAIIARNWLNRDAETAYAYMRHSPLSPRARLLVFGEPVVPVSPSPTVVASVAPTLPTTEEAEELTTDEEAFDPELQLPIDDTEEFVEGAVDAEEIPQD